MVSRRGIQKKKNVFHQQTLYSYEKTDLYPKRKQNQEIVSFNRALCGALCGEPQSQDTALVRTHFWQQDLTD